LTPWHSSWPPPPGDTTPAAAAARRPKARLRNRAVRHTLLLNTNATRRMSSLDEGGPRVVWGGAALSGPHRRQPHRWRPRDQPRGARGLPALRGRHRRRGAASGVHRVAGCRQVRRGMRRRGPGGTRLSDVPGCPQHEPAPKGGSACVGTVPSCCDSCAVGGCAAATTTTTRPCATSTTRPRATSTTRPRATSTTTMSGTPTTTTLASPQTHTVMVGEGWRTGVHACQPYYPRR
jgi:hypothetical protein